MIQAKPLRLTHKGYICPGFFDKCTVFQPYGVSYSKVEFYNVPEMEETILELINRHDILRAGVRWILVNNEKANALPYHHFAHLLTVMHFADQCHRGEFEENVETPVGLLLATLFHDVGHSGGKATDDSENIIRAIGALKEFVIDRIDHPEDDVAFEQACWLIQATRYPHGNDLLFEVAPAPFELEDYHRQVKCIRDADMLALCCNVIQNRVGIKAENFSQMEWKKYLDKTLEFLDGITFHTAFGKCFGDKQRNKAKRLVEGILKLFDEGDKND